MKTGKTRKNKGFTLLEILLVIAAIVILSSIVIVAINPLQQIGKAENAARWGGINTVQKALDQYYIDNGKYPDGVQIGQYQEICNTGSNQLGQGSVDCTNRLDLRALVPTYIAEMPEDPKVESAEKTKISVSINPDNNRIAVVADKPSLGENISINTYNKISYMKPAEGGTASLMRNRSEVVFDSEGNYYVSGHTNSEGEGFHDVYLAKYTIDDQLVWQKILGKSLQDEGLRMIYFNNAVYLTGLSRVSNPTDTNALLVKFNLDGTIDWQRFLTKGTNTRFTGVTTDGTNLYAVGFVENITTGWDALIVKYNQSGTILASKVLSGLSSTTDIQDFRRVVYKNSYIYAAGEDGTSTLVVKLDTSLNTIWQKKISLTDKSLGTDTLNVDDSDNVYVAGTSSNILLTSSVDGLLFKYDSSGVLLWHKVIGDTTGSIQTSLFDSVIDNNNIYISGSTSSQSIGNRDIFFAKYALDGTEIYQKRIGTTSFDMSNGLAINNQGILYLTGESGDTVYRSLLLFKLNKDELLTDRLIGDFVYKNSNLPVNSGSTFNNADSLVSDGSTGMTSSTGDMILQDSASLYQKLDF